MSQEIGTSFTPPGVTPPEPATTEPTPVPALQDPPPEPIPPPAPEPAPIEPEPPLVADQAAEDLGFVRQADETNAANEAALRASFGDNFEAAILMVNSRVAEMGFSEADTKAIVNMILPSGGTLGAHPGLLRFLAREAGVGEVTDSRPAESTSDASQVTARREAAARALRQKEADPRWMEAFLDNRHPLHHDVIAERSRLFAMKEEVAVPATVTPEQHAAAEAELDAIRKSRERFDPVVNTSHEDHQEANAHYMRLQAIAAAPVVEAAEPALPPGGKHPRIGWGRAKPKAAARAKLSPTEAQTVLHKLGRDKEWTDALFNARHPRHKAVMAQRSALLRMGYPNG